jgi:hypothetical protein
MLNEWMVCAHEEGAGKPRYLLIQSERLTPTKEITKSYEKRS